MNITAQFQQFLFSFAFEFLSFDGLLVFTELDLEFVQYSSYRLLGQCCDYPMSLIGRKQAEQMLFEIGYLITSNLAQRFVYMMKFEPF